MSRLRQCAPAAVAIRVLAVLLITACSSRAPIRGAVGTAPTKDGVVVAAPANRADVHFMSGMIPHHAQAVLIAGWAASHGARPDITVLCERIVVGQRDEIELMQGWLRQKGAPVPAADATHLRMNMNGMQHDMLMPGMLSPEELAALDKARGSTFDRLFLQAMIKHHEGAISMVDELLGSEGAAQDDVIYKFASDVYADQTTEIAFMKKMLATIPASGR
jgi:uncharacterized protein (DUF305 family)